MTADSPEGALQLPGPCSQYRTRLAQAALGPSSPTPRPQTQEISQGNTTYNNQTTEPAKQHGTVAWYAREGHTQSASQDPEGAALQVLS